jgi:hypothetical protein
LKDLLGEVLPDLGSRNDGVKVVVTRGSQKQEYNVPQEEVSGRAAATVGQNPAR